MEQPLTSRWHRHCVGDNDDLAITAGSASRATPLILVGKLWPGLVEWVRSSMLSFETPLINSEDVDIPVCVANADEAIALIRQHREEWVARNAAQARPAVP